MAYQQAEGFLPTEQLAAQLADSRHQTAEAIAKHETFRRAVRATVIENVRSGNICLSGANGALESWGEAPYQPRWTVSMTVILDITVDALSADDAYVEAIDRLIITTDDDSAPDPYVHDRHLESAVEVVEQRG